MKRHVIEEHIAGFDQDGKIIQVSPSAPVELKKDKYGDWSFFVWNYPKVNQHIHYWADRQTRKIIGHLKYERLNQRKPWEMSFNDLQLLRLGINRS